VVTAVATIGGIKLGGVSQPLEPIAGGVITIGDIRLGTRPFITSVIPKSVLAGATTQVTISGNNLGGSTFVFSPTGITVSNVVANVAGTAATMKLSVAQAAKGHFTVVATNPAGASDATPILGFVRGSGAFNTISVSGTSGSADADGDTLTNTQELGAGTDPVNPDTDADGYQDGLEVTLISDPLDEASKPKIQQSVQPPAFTFSLLNALNPTGASPPVPRQPSFTFSLLNNLNPTGTSPPVPRQPSFTFSLLNNLNPTGTSPPVPRQPSFTFSLLNKLNPAGSSPPVPQQPSFTFSLLNRLNPTGTAPPIPRQPNVTISILNRLNPGSGTSSPSLPTFSFSLLNTQGATAVLTSLRRESLRNSLTSLGEIRRSNLPALQSIQARRLILAASQGSDSDGDMLPDELERELGSDPNNADSDGDGIPDGVEYLLKGNATSARPEDDDDFDGLSNAMEMQLGTDPTNPDSDNDGLADGDEVNTYHSNPLNPDTDGDGYGDGEEFMAGSDPLSVLSHPPYPPPGRRWIMGPGILIRNNTTSSPSGRQP